MRRKVEIFIDLIFRFFPIQPKIFCILNNRITHQEKIFKLEHSLYRANDIIRDLKAKLELKNKTIARLNASVHYYKKEKAKRDRESEEKAGELIVC